MSNDELTLVGTLEKIFFKKPEEGKLFGLFLEENSLTPIMCPLMVMEFFDFSSRKEPIRNPSSGLLKTIRSRVPIRVASPSLMRRFVYFLNESLTRSIEGKMGNETFKSLQNFLWSLFFETLIDECKK